MSEQPPAARPLNCSLTSLSAMVEFPRPQAKRNRAVCSGSAYRPVRPKPIKEPVSLQSEGFVQYYRALRCRLEVKSPSEKLLSGISLL